MSYRKHSQYTSRSKQARAQETRSSPRFIEQLDTRRHHYSRSLSPDEDVRLHDQPPRRRRWAAGYIDRQSCASYSYIHTRSRSPKRSLGRTSESDYIDDPWSRDDEYVPSRESPDEYAVHHRVHKTSHRTSRDQVQAHRADVIDSQSSVEEREAQYASDTEDFIPHQHTRTSHPSFASYTSDAEAGSDVLCAKKSMGSDVASIRSRRSSRSLSDRLSLRSVGERSDVQRRHTDSGESDSEGGYISLDDYIVGQSDCVSDETLSEDGGEGSDAVGSDVEEVSSPAEASDVALMSDCGDYDDGEDCIDDVEDGYDNYAQRYSRR